MFNCNKKFLILSAYCFGVLLAAHDSIHERALERILNQISAEKVLRESVKTISTPKSTNLRSSPKTTRPLTKKTTTTITSDDDLINDDLDEEELPIAPIKSSVSVGKTTEKSKADNEIRPIMTCDYKDGDICWLNRQVGDSVTLAVNFTEFGEDEGTFTIHWIRLYSTNMAENKIHIPINRDHCPWNMVIGSGGQELRLNPVTDTDFDPTALLAKVLSVSGEKSAKVVRPVKEITFKLNILPIDMGSVYSGEELIINIENFATVPSRGITYEWGVEKQAPGTWEPLPSNMKISRSGKTVTVKELKKNQNIVIVCVFYSSSGMAVAKRRFFIQRPNREYRRSVAEDIENENPSLKKDHTLQRYRRDTQEYLEMPLYAFKINENPMVKEGFFEKRSSTKGGLKVRSVRSETRSIEISDRNDQEEEGTLFGTIPQEVHIVQPIVRLIPHDIPEPSLNQLAERAIYNCTTHFECGPKASCVFPYSYENEIENAQGQCKCNPEYQGDGWRCHKSTNHHREKRVKRQVVNPPLQQQQPIYVPGQMQMANPPPLPPPPPVPEKPPYNMPEYNDRGAFQNPPAPVENPEAIAAAIQDGEDSTLLAPCQGKDECSPRALCGRTPNSLQQHCICKPGFRGNGLFCWEITDYVAPMTNYMSSNFAEPEAKRKKRSWRTVYRRDSSVTYNLF